MIRTTLATALLGAGLLLSNAAAIAGPVAATHTVLLNGFTYASPSTVTVQSAAPGTPIAPFSVYAGQYSGLLDGNPFISFCVELTQYLSFNTSYSDYAIVDGVTAWGAAKSATFDHLVSSILGNHVVVDAASSSMAQSAMWEVLYETASSYGFASGSFSASGSMTAQAQSTGMDWSAIAATPVRYHVDLLHSPTAQDLVLITPLAIPEPGTMPLAVAGCVALAGLARRRRTPARSVAA